MDEKQKRNYQDCRYFILPEEGSGSKGLCQRIPSLPGQRCVTANSPENSGCGFFMGKDEECCLDCKYYKYITPAEDGLDAEGWCRRYPPVLQPCMIFNDEGGAPGDRSYDTFYPTSTKGHYWCGEFKPKI